MSDGQDVSYLIWPQLNLNNLSNLYFVDVAKLHVEFFGYCIKLYLQLFVDYEYCL